MTTIDLDQFPERDACGPKALMQLFNESYDDSCKRIAALGEDYQNISGGVLHDVLQSKFQITKIEEHKKGPEITRWAKAKKKGLWFIATADTLYGGGHAVVLKDGQLLDNGYRDCWLKPKLAVSVAWKLKEAA